MSLTECVSISGCTSSLCITNIRLLATDYFSNFVALWAKITRVSIMTGFSAQYKTSLDRHLSNLAYYYLLPTHRLLHIPLLRHNRRRANPVLAEILQRRRL